MTVFTFTCRRCRKNAHFNHRPSQDEQLRFLLEHQCRDRRLQASGHESERGEQQ